MVDGSELEFELFVPPVTLGLAPWVASDDATLADAAAIELLPTISIYFSLSPLLFSEAIAPRGHTRGF
jgi:hypothetical protein